MPLLSVVFGVSLILQWLLLIGLGIVVGVFCNWAIYSWTWFLYRPISPWQRSHPEATDRRWQDYLPIAGWPGRARDEALFGKWFWVRPMLVELAAVIFIPWFYFWLASGGLVEGGAEVELTAAQPWTWFALFVPFIALLLIGTFIDFDEHVIPDWVTIPGTLLGLVIAAVFPTSRLPERVSNGVGPWTVNWIDYLSPNRSQAPLLEQNSVTLMILLGIFAVWIWALLPKLSPFDVGWSKSIRLMFATIFRPARKHACSLRTVKRSMPLQSKLLFAILIAGVAAILCGYAFLSPSAWQSLTGSMFGLAFGGGMIWSIRIVGTTAMGRQAMGFGDVTLMAMIGATLGWQATLLSFVFTIVLIVVFLVIQVIATGSQELAFGPYLCGGAVVLIFAWSRAWGPASVGLFGLGIWLLYLLAAFPVLMFVMLLGVRGIKGLFQVQE